MNMDLGSLKDLKTTAPGLALLVVQYLINHKAIPADLGDIIFQILIFLMGILLMSVNTKGGSPNVEAAQVSPDAGPGPGPDPGGVRIDGIDNQPDLDRGIIADQPKG